MKPGADITILPSIDSTNIYAMQQVHAHMARHGQVFFALDQTAGKGQRGRQWLSTPGQNIMMSVVFELKGLSTDLQFPFSMAIALACYDFFKSRAGDEVSVKWPNDIYWRDRKAGGILIENLIQAGSWSWAIAGIGLNINQTEFDPSISRMPVSLKQICGRDTDLMEALQDLCNCIHQRFLEFRDHPSGLRPQYEKILFRIGESVRLKKGSRVFEARILGVDDFGQLKVFTTMEECFSHGEIEWL